MKKLAIFASGQGSNFIAIHKNTVKGVIPAKIALFVSDNPSSNAVNYARKNKIPSFIFHPKDYLNKTEYETKILTLLKEYHIDLVILAGYMRIIGPTLLHDYSRHIMNIHPSLLPRFKGKDAIIKAWESNVQYTGVTVHYVDEYIDHGEIILQEEIEIKHKTINDLTKDIHAIEHKLYTKAILKVLEMKQ